ncbi:MAG: GNAT family N-acetyltransferase [Parvibaculum sp.]
MEYVIRSATLADVAAITRLHVDSWQDTYTFMPDSVHSNRSYAYRYEEWLEILSKPDPDHLILTVWDGNILVGFSNCLPCRDPDMPQAKGEMHAIYFRKDYRGHALGAVLFERMIQFLIKRDLWPACLWAFEKNEFRHNYKTIGFTDAVYRDRVIAGVAIPEVGYLSPDSPEGFFDAINQRLSEEESAQQATQQIAHSQHPVPKADQTRPGTYPQNQPGLD